METSISNLKFLIRDTLSKEKTEQVRCLIERKLSSFVKEMTECYSDEAHSLIIKIYAELVSAIADGQSIDLPLVNCCLNLKDICKKLDISAPDSKLLNLTNSELDYILKTIEKDNFTVRPSELHMIRKESFSIPDNFSVTVFAQNDRSLVASYILTHMISCGIKVNLLVTQKRFSRSSIKQEIHLGKYRTFKRRLGKLIEKIIRKVKPEEDYIEIRNVASKESINSDLNKICKENNIKMVYVEGFNTSECHSALNQFPSSIGLYLGKEIIRKKTIDQFEKGIIHNHPGRIPLYRGMDCVEWALLQKEDMNIGSSIQLLTPQLDAGPVLHFEKLQIKSDWSINVIRSRVLFQGIRSIINFFSNMADNVECTYYDPSFGRQYYVMHPKLKKLIKR